MMTLSQKEKIKNLDDLRIHLQFAIGLELSTVPVYLSALYSIPDGQNTAASRLIQSVVVEEMLHMALAANILNGIGGIPSTNKIAHYGDPIPIKFPATILFLPCLGPLHLRRFSRKALDLFIEIEHPGSRGDSPAEGYGSIGAFYEAICTGIEDYCSPEVFEDAKNKRGCCQIKPNEYYGGAGNLIVVSDKDSALKAIDEIVDQGEGLPPAKLDETAKIHGVRPGYLGPLEADTIGARPGNKIDDGDKLADGWKMYSHYARFREIAAGRRYQLDQKIGDKPRGDVLPIDWDEVYPMALDPSGEMYAGTEVMPAIDAFNATYTKLLNTLYSAFNGESAKMRDAVTMMWSLKYEAVALMKTPSPIEGKEGLTVGAPFEYQR